MKAKILITDPGSRFKTGEVGTVLKNDFIKYDYKIHLGTIKNAKLTDGTNCDYKRIFYFYKTEVEVLPDADTKKDR